MSGLASLLIDSSIQRTLSSFAKRHAWAFSQGALIAPSLPSLLSVALLDDLSAVARMSSAINFFLGRPLRSAGAAISGRARGLLQRTGAGRVRGALPHAMPTVPHLRREAAYRALPLDHGPHAAHSKMLTRHARCTHAGRTQPLAEPSLKAFMAGCRINGCSEPRVKRWSRFRAGRATFGLVHAALQVGCVCRSGTRGSHRW